MWTRRLTHALPALVVTSLFGCQPTMSDLHALNPRAETLQVPCHPSQIPQSVRVMAVQSGSGHIVTDENPDELMSIAPSASVFIEFNGDAPDRNAGFMESEYGLSCPDELRPTVRDSQYAARPDPRFLGQTAKASAAAPDSKATSSPATKPLPRTPVCARPPGITSDEWLGSVKGVTGINNATDREDYAKYEANAGVIFYFDASAPPESVWNFGPDTKVRCPGKAPMPFKQYQESQNAKTSQGGSGTATTSKATTGTTTTTTTTTTKKGDGKTTDTSSRDGKGPPLSVFERISRNLAVGGALAQGDTSGNLKDPNGDRSGIPGGKNVGGFSFPPLQAGVSQCTEEVVEVTHYKALGRTDITVVLGEHDERVSKLMALLAAVDEKPFVIHTDIYTEDERQTAPLLILQPWGHVRAWGGPWLGTSYDIAQACQRCGAGARQTSDMIIANDDVRRIEKLRIAATTFENVLLNDDDVDRLITAQVSGALFWPVHAKTKAGNMKELRRQQVCVEHVLPPMAPSSHLDRTQVCPSCRRGCFTHVAFHPLRLVYRRQDLANIQDINLTWEWFGDYAGSPEEALAGRWPDPLILITPKVMNLLRGKTKKEQKSQGCDFIPIWIEDEKT